MSTPYWLIGAPFDVITLHEAGQRILLAARQRKRLLFVTPNVSFLAEAARNPQFHDDILRADLSLADGAPIVWLGRLSGIPFPERVAGSDLLDLLMDQDAGNPLRVFFFGGEPGAADEAMQTVNARRGGIVAVGAHNPGFVSVQEMSDGPTIDLINRSGADFLVVALGASKGHRWIELNRDRLDVPVISHLGAAINFVSGRLRRAPPVLRRTGLEWLWRIKEEPALVRRYARDSWFLALNGSRLIVREVAARMRLHRTAHSMAIQPDDAGNQAVLVTGVFEAAQVGRLEKTIESKDARPVRIHFRNVTRLDALAVGWLYTQTYRTTGRKVALSFDSVSQAALQSWRAQILASVRQVPGMPE